MRNHDQSNRAVQSFHASVRFVEGLEQSVPDRFEEQAAKYPDQLAVKTRDYTFTYDALNQAANRVARELLAKRGQSEEPIVLLLDHDAPMIVAILAVLKAGKICVVLDPSYAQARASYILADSQAKRIVTNNKNIVIARHYARQGQQLINIDEIDSNLPGENLGLPISPDAFACILYTSGSTGQPKGVIQNHRNVIHNAMRYANSCRISAGDRVTLLASLGTGQGTPTAFSALLNGAALYPLHVKEEGVAGLSTWLEREEITVYISTPTLFRHFVGTLTGQENFPKLHIIRLGAEQIRKSDVELYKKYFPSHCTLAIFLSATETGNICQYFVDKQTEITGDSVPVGYPVDGMEILLLDDSGKEVGPNEIGEIAVKSRYLSPGYWRRPDLTQAAFLPDPNGGDKHIYRTGDLGRMSRYGCLEHMGRMDFQIKIRGYRVEIAEIESALLRHAQVKETVVVAMESENRTGDLELIAYVVPAGQPAPKVSELRNYLKEKLPDYMVPAAFVMLEFLPLNPTGKVDRQALPPPSQIDRQRSTPYAPPVEAVEHELVEIWEELLGVRPIGVQDDFFEVGGNSLLAAQMMHRIAQACGVSVPLSVLFTGSTIEKLAKALVEQRAKGTESLHIKIQSGGANAPKEHCPYIVELQSGRGKIKVFFFAGGGGGEPEFLIYAKLARHVGMDYSFYGLRARGADGKSKPHRRVEEMVADYIQAIRTVQPHGPYFLVGECIGGIAAHEAARQLQAEGEKIALLALMDTRRLTRIDQLFEPVRDNYFIQRIPYHWKIWCALDYRERIPYLFEKIGNAFGSNSHPLQPMDSKRSRAQAVVEVNRDRRTVEHIDWIRARYSRVLRWHKPKPYEGRIHILVNEEYYNRDPTSGWGQLALKGLKIHKLPGNHDTYIREHINATAQELRHCLDTAASKL